jgi:Fe-S-cluster containining protein
MPRRGDFLGLMMQSDSREKLIPRLVELYRRMDEAYSFAAAAGGFSCRGCDGAKCCTVDLILHTLVERLYLRRGFDALDPRTRERILARSRQMVLQKQLDPHGEGYRNMVCVLNEEGRCTLYEYRPMICRLAGIAHTFTRPDGQSISGDGCFVFEREIRSRYPDLAIDRTPFYSGIAELESDALTCLRRSRQKPCTIAELFGSGLETPPNWPCGS